MKKTSRRAVIAGAGAFAAAGTASAQTQAPAQGPTSAPAQPQGQTPPAAPAPARPRVLITTALGPITLELASDKAPITCANFLRYMDAKKFDNQGFYRAMKVMASPPVGLVQAGADRVGRFPPIKHESTLATGLTHKNGAVSMARAALDSATADFFICIDDLSSSLDANPKNPGDNQGFAVFAQVVDGMPVVKQILTSPTSPTKGEEWGMKGQILDPEIKIMTIRRV